MGLEMRGNMFFSNVAAVATCFFSEQRTSFLRSLSSVINWINPSHGLDDPLKLPVYQDEDNQTVAVHVFFYIFA